jgi:ATP-dependent RNA helicase DeaD
MKFEELNLKPKLLEGIKNMHYKEATGIQEKCIPLILDGKDVIGQSLTGSGKTAAFAIPLLNKINIGIPVQVIVLTPTRELAQQVKEHMEDIGRYLGIKTTAIYGGVGFDGQISGIRKSEVIVGTPGRLLDHLGRRTLSLKNIEFIVLDEADRMFDMGFEKDVNKILSFIKGKKQTILFSATMPQAAKEIAQRYLENPVHIKEQAHVDESLLKHSYYVVDGEKKFSLLVHLLNKANGSAIVFCRTKRGVDRLNKSLKKHKISSMAIHGDITQNKRQFAVQQFKEGKIDVLVATDVAARGIDISGVSHVYNFDVPKEEEDYTHRVGRTARAGKKGEAVTIVAKYDARDFDKILKRKKIDKEELPEFETLMMAKKEEGDDREDSARRGFGSRGRSSFGDREGYRGRSGGRSSGRNFGRSSGGRRFSDGGGSRRSYGRSSSDVRSNYSQDGDSKPSFGGKSNYSRDDNGGLNTRPSYGGESFDKRSFGGEARPARRPSFGRSESRGRNSYSRDSNDKPRSSFGGRNSYSRDSNDKPRSSFGGRSNFNKESKGKDDFKERSSFVKTSDKPVSGSDSIRTYYDRDSKPHDSKPFARSSEGGRSKPFARKSSGQSTGAKSFGSKLKPRRRSTQSATRGFTNSGRQNNTSPKTFSSRKKSKPRTK